jgi:putative glycosyltransferase (TIGR04372 family)
VEPLREYVSRHAAEIRRGGLRALLTKIRHFTGRNAVKVVMLLPALLGVLVIRAMRPFRLVRIGQLMGSRIGHYVGDTELYLCERDEHPAAGGVDVFFHQRPVSNTQIERMWDRVLCTSRFFRHIAWVNAALPGGSAHTIDTTLVDWDGLLERHVPHLSFTEAEEAEGAQRLAALAGSPDIPFVCFHNRDAAYLAGIQPYSDWTYHAYRDSRIESFRLAAETIARRGYAALRMGAVVKAPISAAEARVIDYASTARSDFMDVYLEAHCRFHFGDTTGLNEIPRAFRRPVVYMNAIPLDAVTTHSLAPGGIFIPKKLRRRGDGEWLSLAEIAALAADHDVYRAHAYDELGIDVVDNTAEEIRDVVLEMDERIDGTWVETPEDRELQARFWSLFGQGPLGPAGTRIGAEFLRGNRELLA